MLLKHALYAEEASDVSIIFTDIVGFSAMSMKVDSILIMDMLHDLFHCFDMISKKVHDIQVRNYWRRISLYSWFI